MAPLARRTAQRSRTGLSVALWVVQILLAALFLNAGFLKATQPIASIAPMIPWAPDVPEPLVRFIGVSELAGAIGLVLPAWTRIRPTLTPLAACGLVVVMLLAALFHISRGEWMNVPFVLTLGALAAFVAWGRLTRAPIPPRGTMLA
jgi:putative oxidoreductase